MSVSRTWRMTGVGLLMLIVGTGCASTGKFEPLFDGKTLDGWTAYSSEGEKIGPEECSFSVKDGTLHCSGHGKDYWIARNETYRDCVLRLEYKVTKAANSGVFLRSPGPAHPAFTGYEVQIYDDAGGETNTHCSGSIYDVVAPTENTAKPAGEWNVMEITHDGSKVKVVLNGVTVIDCDFAEFTEPIGKFDFPYSKMPREGLVGVQNHGGELTFRNIEIKVLD